jgi:hypothetical protein
MAVYTLFQVCFERRVSTIVGAIQTAGAETIMDEESRVVGSDVFIRRQCTGESGIVCDSDDENAVFKLFWKGSGLSLQIKCSEIRPSQTWREIQTLVGSYWIQCQLIRELLLKCCRCIDSSE